MNSRIIYILIGLFIVFYTFYMRVIHVRLPKNLFFVENCYINYGLILIVILWIITSIVIIYQSAKILLKKKKNYKFEFLINIIIKIAEFIEKALLEFYSYLFNLVPDAYYKLAKLVAKFYNRFAHLEFLFILISYFCRLIIVIIFLIDVFYFFKLHYFYKSLILLCVPICINIWYYILEDFSKNLEDTESYLIIKHKGIDVETNLPITEYSPSAEYDFMDRQTLNYYVKQYILLSKITGYLEVYNKILKYYGTLSKIIIYTMYLIGWLYVIYINLFLLNLM